MPAAPASRADRRGRHGESSRVLVLNSSYEPLNVCTVRRAVVLVLKEKAEMLETGIRQIHAESMTMPHPGRLLGAPPRPIRDACSEPRRGVSPWRSAAEPE